MPDQTSTSFYRWEPPGSPVRIDLSFEVVERLEREIVNAFRAVAGRGSEVGGVLIGTPATNGTPAAITDYRLLPCTYSRGPLFILTDAEKGKLRDAARQEDVIGFFRSHTRRDLGLSDEDCSLARDCFSSHGAVFLVVKPFAAKAPVAGFCLWQGSEIQRSPSAQFPFRAPSGLARGPVPEAAASPLLRPGDISVPPEAPSLATAAAPESEMPHPAELQSAASTPLQVRPPLPPAVACDTAGGKTGAGTPPEGQDAGAVDAAGITGGVTDAEKSPGTPQAPAASPSGTASGVPEPEPDTVPLARYHTQRPSRFAVLAWVLIAATALAGSGLLLLHYDIWQQPPAPAPPVGPAAPALTGTASERSQPEAAIPAGELTRLTVSAEAEPKPHPPVRQAVLPPAPKPRSIEVPEPPRVESRPAPLTLRLPNTQLPAPPQVSPGPPPGAPDPVPVTRGPVALRQTMPVYPPAARYAGVQGLVRVRVVVGPDGKVRSAHIVSGPQALRQAAADAVRHWIYQPAVRDRQPVEGASEVEVKFSLR